MAGVDGGWDADLMVAAVPACISEIDALLSEGKRSFCGKLSAGTTVTGTSKGAGVLASEEWRMETNNRLSSAACNSKDSAGAW